MALAVTFVSVWNKKHGLKGVSHLTMQTNFVRVQMDIALGVLHMPGRFFVLEEFIVKYGLLMTHISRAMTVPGSICSRAFSPHDLKSE